MSKIPANFHLLKEILLPEDAFLEDNSSFTLPTVFQIWEKRQALRGISKKLIPQNFSFVEKSQACLCVCRTGNAGYATILLQDKKQSHHYFIKILNGKDAQELVNIINRTSIIERDFTIGAPSISKQELTYYLNKILK